VNINPPTIVPKKMEEASHDNQAPIIPPTAMLASNKKNHIARLKSGVRSCGKIVRFRRNRGEAKREMGVSAGPITTDRP
jgi:hypothetical protein